MFFRVLLAIFLTTTLLSQESIAQVAFLSEEVREPLDCNGVRGGGAVIDQCGICGGLNRALDICGVCFGDGTSCLDCAGIPFGAGQPDACGICNGPGTGVCPGCPFGDRSCLLPACPSVAPTVLGANDNCVANPFVNQQAAGRVDFVVVNRNEIGFQLGFDGGLTTFRPTTGKVRIPANVFKLTSLEALFQAQGALRQIGARNTNACFICSTVRVIGCFPPGERVQLADGSLVKVENLRVGDMVWNPVTQKGQRILEVVEGSETLPLIEFGYGDTLLKVTQEHPIMTLDGVKKANELEIGIDIIYAADGSQRLLSTLRELPVQDGQFVINFTMEAESDSPEHHMVAAEGLTVGDLALQKAIGS